MDLKKYMQEKKRLVDSHLEDYLKSCDCEPKLGEAMRYSLLGDGKRIRPILAIAAAEACGGDATKVKPIAIALEMIHAFSLIHDDLPAMDDDDLRRGKPTNHKVYGEATAILAGDGLFSEAFRCLAAGGVSADIISDIATAAGPQGMIGGQMIDLLSESKDISSDDLEKLHSKKTGALITVSVLAGAKAVSANESHLKNLKIFGDSIGLAFQVVDDILDIEGDEKETGKPSGSDEKKKKSTYPSILGLDKSKKLAKNLVDRAFSSLAEFDSNADPLRQIARFVVSRKK